MYSNLLGDIMISLRLVRILKNESSSPMTLLTNDEVSNMMEVTKWEYWSVSGYERLDLIGIPAINKIAIHFYKRYQIVPPTVFMTM